MIANKIPAQLLGSGDVEKVIIDTATIVERYTKKPIH